MQTFGAIRSAILYPARHVRWRIIAPFAVLTMLIATVGTYMVTNLVMGSFEERFNNQLAEAARVASDSVVRRERKHLETVRGVAFTQGVGAAAERRDPFALAALVQPLAANSGTERIEVLDASGRRLFGARLEDAGSLKYASIIEPGDRSSWPAVQRIRDGTVDQRGDKYAEIETTLDGPTLYTSGPIFDGDRLAGIVLVGSPLRSFLATAKHEVLADITVFDLRGATLASTFALDGTVDDLVKPNATIVSDSGVTSPAREHKRLFGRDFDLLYGNLVVRGQTVGIISVGLPSSFILSAGSTTRWRTGTLFAVATLAVLFIGWLIGRSITDPLFRLARAARAVTLGDLSARSSVGGHDEIGALGSAFDAMTERLQHQHLATIRALTSAIDARDPYTMGHSLRVGQLAVEIGTEMGLEEVLVHHLEIGGYLHDIGKIGVRDAILLKAGALTAEERAAIERHPRIGLDIIENLELPGEVIEFVGAHHEKLNGSGYPEHLLGEGIGIVPRIAAVADIYDAITTDRPYRKGMTLARAFEILHAEADEGKLDEAVVLTLERVIPRWEARRRREPALEGFRFDAAGPPRAA